MEKKKVPLLVGAQTVASDLGVSRTKAYEIINELNNALKKENPKAIIVSGRVNRIWYEECCLLKTK